MVSKKEAQFVKMIKSYQKTLEMIEDLIKEKEATISSSKKTLAALPAEEKFENIRKKINTNVKIMEQEVKEWEGKMEYYSEVLEDSKRKLMEILQEKKLLVFHQSFVTDY